MVIESDKHVMAAAILQLSPGPARPSGCSGPKNTNSKLSLNPCLPQDRPCVPHSTVNMSYRARLCAATVPSHMALNTACTLCGCQACQSRRHVDVHPVTTGSQSRHHEPLVRRVCPHVRHACVGEWLLLLEVPASILTEPVRSHSLHLGPAAIRHTAPLLTAAAAHPADTAQHGTAQHRLRLPTTRKSKADWTSSHQAHSATAHSGSTAPCRHRTAAAELLL
jgi:hypothetical protein